MLYNDYRPEVFADVSGQPSAIGLRNTVKARKIPHALLLSGPRGTGKTTLARIFARAINCRKPKNGEPCRQCEACQSNPFMEVSADSLNDEKGFKRLQDFLRGMPKYRYQVAIIDEAQGLNKQFQTKGFLKLLEEPPKRSVMIMLTTNPETLTDAVKSRCIWWPIRGVALDKIEARVTEIAQSENIKIAESAIQIIAQEANGSMRDALSLLESFVAYNRPITGSMVRELISGANTKKLFACITKERPLVEWLKEADNLCSLYSAKSILYELSKRLQDYGRQLLIDEDESGSLLMQVAVALHERSKERVIDERTHVQIALVQVQALMVGKQMEESDPGLWDKFLISVPVGVEAGIYPKSILTEYLLIKGATVKGKTIEYKHFFNEEVSPDLQKSFADYTQKEFTWRLIRDKSTDKQNGRGKQDSKGDSKRKQGQPVAGKRSTRRGR